MPPRSLAECYRILGLRPDASLTEVQAAFRDLAQIWHPDRFENHSPRLKQKANDTLRDIVEAYRRIQEDVKSGAHCPHGETPSHDVARPKPTSIPAITLAYVATLALSLLTIGIVWWVVASRETENPAWREIPLPAQPSLPPELAAPQAQSRRAEGTTTGKKARAPIVVMEFAQIPAGEFKMGSEGGQADETPVHLVSIPRPFQIGRYEVTQAQWQAVMGSNPSYFVDVNRPVERVSWLDVQEFTKRLNDRGDGYRYRLPTEAEWEYAARADGGWSPSNLSSVAWHEQNSSKQTHPVGHKQPNPWGLQDIFGNVFEWCQDVYEEDYYGLSPAVDPPGPASGPRRVVRGGSFLSVPWNLYFANRWAVASVSRFNNFGFRCVRERIP